MTKDRTVSLLNELLLHHVILSGAKDPSRFTGMDSSLRFASFRMTKDRTISLLNELLLHHVILSGAKDPSRLTGMDSSLRSE